MSEQDFNALGKSTGYAAHDASHLERFENPNADHVSFVSKEVTAICPVTGQPDIYQVSIYYQPAAWCVESKSLKLYLNSFRDRGIFGEALAVEIADAFYNMIEPWRVTVETIQQARGGIVMTSSATRSPHKTPTMWTSNE